MPTITPLLTRQERRVLDAIRTTNTCKITAIATAANLPQHQVVQIARALKQAGWIRALPGRRGIEVLNPTNGRNT